VIARPAERKAGQGARLHPRFDQPLDRGLISATALEARDELDRVILTTLELPARKTAVEERDRQTERALRESIDCFERAIASDAKFAAAYAGLADAYNVLAQYGYMAPSEGMQKARADRIDQRSGGYDARRHEVM